ncbi:MAG: hypothetical protein JNL72_11530 [Flavipsychrobacter sp.]|nr:hypothetical protein [Flavipsychrobacter sp.]
MEDFKISLSNPKAYAILLRHILNIEAMHQTLMASVYLSLADGDSEAASLIHEGSKKRLHELRQNLNASFYAEFGALPPEIADILNQPPEGDN